MRALEDDIEALARKLVDGILAKGETEFMADFGEVFPVQIFLKLFGLPLEHTEQFLKWENLLLHSRTIEGRQEGARAIVAYLRKVIAERRVDPVDDLLSYVATTEIEGRKLTPDEALGVAFLLYSAGLDTVANMLGFMFKHFAEHPQDQQKLRDDPALIPDALEELMRAYPIVVSGREVTRDVEFHGVKMRKGDVVSLATMLAGRDEREFPNPDVVDFGREKVSHITFAAGPHRCVGSHLARHERQVREAIQVYRAGPCDAGPHAGAVRPGGDGRPLG
jgi:cytochrome P450